MRFVDSVMYMCVSTAGIMPTRARTWCVGNAIGSSRESTIRIGWTRGEDLATDYVSIMVHVSTLPNSTARLGRNMNARGLERSEGATCLGTPIRADAGSFEWWEVVEEGKPCS